MGLKKMKLHIIASALTSTAWLGVANAQTINETNYRSYARCAETLVGGKWFNTFGEGRCPPGSRRSISSAAGQSDVNAQTMRQTEASVAALGAMQQSVLSLGRSINRAYQAASDKRAETYAYHLYTGQTAILPGELYTARKVNFPSVGTVVVARAGEPILTESDGFFSDCFIPLQGGEAKQIGGHVHTIQPDELTCKLKRDEAAFTPLYNNYSFSGGSMSMGQTLKLKGEAYQLCYRNMGMNVMCVKDIPRDKVIETFGVVEMKETAHGTVFFKGISEGKLLLESSGLLSSYDVSTSKTVQINGFEFEILQYNDNELVARRK